MLARSLKSLRQSGECEMLNWHILVGLCWLCQQVAFLLCNAAHELDVPFDHLNCVFSVVHMSTFAKFTLCKRH